MGEAGRGGDGVVHYQRDAVPVRGLGDRVDVVDLDVRVADGLDIHGLGLVVDQLLIGFWVAPVRDEPGFDAVIRKEPVE
ncbi:hypothetical protein MCC01954_14140 [Bifidobacteriaceae bacterium MCC01954]|jgi:hypothetical protein|nr:hypothetical protein MCC01954_14140 [Bifidobacteriaceae bacterium MCC01954]